MKTATRYLTFVMPGVLTLLLFCAAGDMAEASNSKTGEAGFKEHCSACHPDGGNNIKKTKTLSKQDREKYGVITEKDIMEAMRKPSAWCLTTFSKEALPDNEANEIAEYIIKMFK